MALEPITRAEQIMSGESLEPITREEMFLAKAAGMDVDTPEPITRREMFLSKISGGGGGSTAPVVEPLSVTENGTYEAPAGVDGYNPVTVNVAGSGGDDGILKSLIERTITEITFPSGLTKIGKYAFRACTNLELTSLPSAVTYIADYAFYDCQKLALTELPAGATYIGSYAFSGCQKLALTELPAGVTYIGSYAFRENMHLFSLTFKGTPETISTDAFKSCGNLKILNVPWAEGEVSGAPWGATNATINYNYTGG